MKKILLFLSLFSCKKESGYKTYIIQKGEHYSNHGLEFLKSNELKFEVIFSENCLYEDTTGDINKLYGFCEANSTPHENSARFGWKPDNKGNIEIYSYVYYNGERIINYINTIEVNRKYRMSITTSKEQYFFYLFGMGYIWEERNNQGVGFYTKLFPYFGGNDPAPHKMTIKIREIII